MVTADIFNISTFFLGKPKNKLLDAVGSDSRRGSLVPPGSRRGSRQGSISLAGTERRGSYYGDDVSKRATVAVVVDGDKGKIAQFHLFCFISKIKSFNMNKANSIR